MKKKNTSSIRRSLQLESLEDRRVLTSLPFYSTPFVVPQDSTGTEYTNPYGSLDSIEITTQPEHGDLIFKDGELSYRPDPGYVGEDSFAFERIYEVQPREIIDRGIIITTHAMDWAYNRTVNVNVVETLYAVPDWFRVPVDSGSTNLMVLDNDYVFAQSESNSSSDVFRYLGPTGGWQLAAGGLTIVSVEAANGTATIQLSDDGSFVQYTPNTDFSGVDEVTYIVEDAWGHQSTATATVEVSSQPVSETQFTSEAEFLHWQIDRWMEQNASRINASWDGVVHHRIMDDILVFPTFPIASTSLTTDAFQRTTAETIVQSGDIVKSDGQFLYVVSNSTNGDYYYPTAYASTLTIVDVRDASNPTVLSSIEFDEPVSDLFLTEGRITAITEAGISYHTTAPSEHTIHVLDITTPDSPRVAYSTTIDGDYQQSRVVGDLLYTISNREAGIQMPSLHSLVTGNVTSPAPYIDALMVEGSSSFLPSMDIVVSSSGQTESLNMVSWQDFEKTGTTSLGTQIVITTFDLSGTDGRPVDIDTTTLDYVSTIHVTGESIYLVGSGYVNDNNLVDLSDFSWNSNNIVKFDVLSDGTGVEYAATGTFSGNLLNEFSLNEYEGRLRLATTGRWSTVDILVMEQNGTSLEIVGQLEDIAPNEQVYSTRFEGNRGFVVTFRKVDPLFVIDFSNPTQPTIQGELKVPGYSNYLHVVGENHLLGIGRNADESSGLFQELQISLFDITDPANPTLVDRYSFGGGRTTWSPAVDDAWNLTNHQAVTFVEEAGILALPVFSRESWGPQDTHIFAEGQSAVSVFRIDVSVGIEELGQVEFSDKALRSLATDQHLISMSNETIKITALDDPNTLISSLQLPDSGAHNVDMLPFLVGPDLDINQDGLISPIDPLLAINALNEEGFGEMSVLMNGMAGGQKMETMKRMDVNEDGIFSPLDALLIINSLDYDPSRVADADQDFPPNIATQQSEDLPTSTAQNSTIEATESRVSESAEVQTVQQAVSEAPVLFTVPIEQPRHLNVGLGALHDFGPNQISSWEAVFWNVDDDAEEEADSLTDPSGA